MTDQQMENWRCCQKCGRVIQASKAREDGWLVSPYLNDTELLIVRCFRHWSEWSMRNSVMGRSKLARQKMKEGRLRAAQEHAPIPALYEPFPLGDKKL